MNSRDEDALPRQDKLLLVHAYLDGELDAANAVKVKREIEADGQLSNELANASALQQALRAHFPHEPVPEHLRLRIDRAIGRHSGWRQPTWGAMAASVLLAISLSASATWLTLRDQHAQPVVAEVVDTHMRSLIAASPMDVDNSDRHVVKPWFNGRLPQAPRVVDLESEGFPLKGARIDVIAKTPVPTLVYSRRRHVISLLATSSSEIAQKPSDTRFNGYNVVHWADGKTSYWAVSDLNAQELETFTRLFRDAPG